MSEDAKQELEAVREQLRVKTGESSTYFKESEHLRVLFIYSISLLDIYLCHWNKKM